MLDVSRNRGIYVIVGTFLVREQAAHCPAVLDEVVDTFHLEHSLKFSVRDECRVQQLAAVKELLVFGENETQRVRARENHLHPTRSKDVGEQCRPLDEVSEQSYFVNENVAETECFQKLEVVIDVGERKPRIQLDECCLGPHFGGHLANRLAHECRLARTAQPVEYQDAVVILAVDVIV